MAVAGCNDGSDKPLIRKSAVMEVRFAVGNDQQDVEFFMDIQSGSLCISTDKGIIEIPNSTANELIGLLRLKLAEHDERNKKYFWQ